jgi:hypothetical protein
VPSFIHERERKMTEEERKQIERGDTARPVEALENGVVHEKVGGHSHRDCVHCINCRLNMLVEKYADACPVCGVEALTWHAAAYDDGRLGTGMVVDDAWEEYFYQGGEPPMTPEGEPRSHRAPPRR